MVPYNHPWSRLSPDKFSQPLKIKKVNIGSPENPKLSNIGDYWDDETVGKITDLLHEFQYLFPIRNEMNCWGFGRNEDSPQNGCKSYQAATIEIEFEVQREG